MWTQVRVRGYLGLLSLGVVGFGFSAGSVAAAAADSSAAAGNTGLEEIVVTARRRAENLQDVPVAVTAISATTLVEQNVTNLQDLNSFTPNIKVSADRATNSTINVYIRGVGQSDPLWGFEPGVGIYIDDVYLARPQSALLDVYDVDRIEVLRGPQGTLYGKNTIAGAIKYVTHDIVGPATATASVTAGTFGEIDEKLNASMPVIADHLYVGASVAHFIRSGYGQVIAEGAQSPYNRAGEQVSNKDLLAARGNLTAVWGGSSKLRLAVDTIQDNSNATGGQRLNDVLAPELNSRYDVQTDMPVNRDRFLDFGSSATYTQDLLPDLSMKLVGAYRNGSGRQFIDFDEQNSNLFNVPDAYLDHQASGEGQLTWTTDFVKAVGGFFYMNNAACGAYDVSLGVLSAPPPNGLDLYLTSLTSGCTRTKTTALYTDTAWKLTDALNFDVGVRWNRDRKTGSVYVAQYASLAPTQLLPNQTFFDSTQVPTGFFPLGGGLHGVPGLESDYSNTRTFSNVSPRAGFDYHLTPKIMTYFTYSRGFKSGGFDMRGNQLAYPGTSNGYNSETADNFEVGLKSTLLDDRLIVDVTAFYDPYKNVQITVAGFEPVGGVPTNVSAVLNAGKQMNRGIEFESTYRVAQPLTLVANLGYLDSYYENVQGCIPGSIGCNASSNVADLNRPINAPLWSGSLTGNYTWPWLSGSMLAHAGWEFRSFTKVANTTSSVTDQPAYGIFNAGLAWTSSSNAWRFALEGRNLADRWYRTAGYDFGGPGTGVLASVSQIGFYGPPRTVTVTGTYHY